MSTPLRICLLDMSASGDTPFRQPFEALEGAEIVDVCRTWQPLQEHLRVGRIDLVAVNLDAGDPQANLHHVERIAEVSPECGIIGVGADAHPDRIIAAMRAGCGQFVRWPIDAQDLRVAVATLRRLRIPVGTVSRRIGVVGASGGAGATTLACNLALELAHLTERRCALVDMNLAFGDVACAFDVHPRHTLGDLCRPGVEVDRTLLEMALEELPCKVSVLARPERIEQVDEVAPQSVYDTFRILEQMFPFVLADLPRHFSPATLAALEGADRVLLVTQLAVPQLRNALRLYEYLLGLGTSEDRVEIVLNRWKANHERITPQEVERQFRKPAFACIPNDYKHIGASRDLGHPLMSGAPASPARLVIREIARQLAAHLLADEEPRKGGGLLGLFGRRAGKPRQPAT